MNLNPDYLEYTLPDVGKPKEKAPRKRPAAEPLKKQAPAASRIPKPSSAKRAKTGDSAATASTVPEVVPSSSPSLVTAAEVVPSSTPASAATGTPPHSDPSPPSLEKGKQVLASDSVSPLCPSATVPRPSGFKRSQAWSGDVSEEIGMAFFPPRRFLSPQPLSDEDLHEIQDVSGRLCKALGLSQAYPHLHGYYVRASAESRALKQNLESAEEKVKQLAEEKERAEAERDELKTELKSSQIAADKAGEDLLSTHQALTQAHTDLRQTQDSLAEVNHNLADANSRLAEANANLTELKSSHSLSMDAVKRLTQQRSELCTQLEQTRGDLEEEKTAHEKAVVAVRKTASDCFAMALAQIEYLNPGVKLNVAGYGCRSRFQDGVLIPPPLSLEDRSASDAEVSSGEQVAGEATSGAGPDGDEATADKGAP